MSLDLLRLAVGQALAEGRPVEGVLEAFHLGRSASAAEVRAGRLDAAMCLLGFSPGLAALAQAWAPAVLLAQRMESELPDRRRLLLPLYQTLAYLTLVALVQSVVVALLRFKVRPALAAMARDLDASGSGAFFLDLGPFIPGALAVVLLLVVLYAAWGLAGPTWVPGWGRSLAQSREAVVVAALLEARAPAEVVGRWRAASRWLQGELPLLAEDVRGLARHHHLAAEAGLDAVITRLRWGGMLGLLAVGALQVLAIYGVVAGLGGLR